MADKKCRLGFEGCSPESYLRYQGPSGWHAFWKGHDYHIKEVAELQEEKHNLELEVNNLKYRLNLAQAAHEACEEDNAVLERVVVVAADWITIATNTCPLEQSRVTTLVELQETCLTTVGLLHHCQERCGDKQPTDRSRRLCWVEVLRAKAHQELAGEKEKKGD